VFKNWITARTSHLSEAASGSSITNGCRTKTERPSGLSDGLFGSGGTNEHSNVANSHANSFPAAPALWRPYFWGHPCNSLVKMSYLSANLKRQCVHFLSSAAFWKDIYKSAGVCRQWRYFFTMVSQSWCATKCELTVFLWFLCVGGLWPLEYSYLELTSETFFRTVGGRGIGLSQDLLRTLDKMHTKRTSPPSGTMSEVWTHVAYVQTM
jgi:hypothetical protein